MIKIINKIAVARKDTLATKKRKASFLKALEKSKSISHACLNANIPRRTFYQWRAKDPEFIAKVENVEMFIVALAETTLVKLISEKDLGAIKFYLKYKGKKYGWDIDDDGLKIRLQQAQPLKIEFITNGNK